MADNAVDSTKNEEDGTDSADTKVSSSFGAHGRQYSDSTLSSAQDGNQEVSSSDITESGCLSQAPKVPSTSVSPYSNAFYGNSHNAGMYTNPFVPRAPLKSDVVSTDQSSSGDNREGLIAPSKLSAFVNRDSSEAEGFAGDRGFPKQSMLAPPKLTGAVFGGARQDTPSSTFSSFNSFNIRPSVFSSPFDSGISRPGAPLLKPAKLPDPTKLDGKADSPGEAEVLSATTKSSEAFSVSERLSGADGASGGSEVTSSSSTTSSSLPHPQTLPNPPTLPDAEGAVGGESTPYNQDIVPDINKNNRLKDSSGVSSSSQSFVFGSNISQRVTGVTSSPLGNEASASGFVFGESLGSRVVAETNGSAQAHKDDESDSDSGNKLNQTLEESAREYQAKHENRTELKEVETITGEEEESNVLQANAKLFFFETSNESWVERGRGTIRLNDMSARDNTNFQSRLVMRTQGSLRVVLNAKIWPGMSVERASAKSIRITAMDTDESIRIFLITTNTKDSENLLRAIDWRIQQLKIQEEPARQLSDVRSGDKRKADDSDFELPLKSKKMNSPPDQGISITKKEESDSSVQDPETEASCESHSSSLTIKSESD